MEAWFSDLQADFQLNFIDDARWHYLWTGLGNTMKITLGATLMGILIGVIVAIVRASYDKN